MGKLHQTICKLADENRYVIDQHAAERAEQGDMNWLLRHGQVCEQVVQS